MLSNARGKHSSPGVYMEEINKTYATRSLGITTLGVVGETLKGPAFEPVRISDWMEFQDYFGGTSTEKFNKGKGYPKYELPYIAKSYLQESKQLDVCRVLGLSGYNAGEAWAIYGYDSTDGTYTSGDKYVIGILRSKANYKKSTSETCNGNSSNEETINWVVSSVTMSADTSISIIDGNCTSSTSATTMSLKLDGDTNKYGKFLLTVTNNDGTVIKRSLSLDPSDKNYIVNELGMSAQDGDYPLFVEELYDLAHIKNCEGNNKYSLYNTIGIEELKNLDVMSDYKSMYRSALTPWFVSELKGSGTDLELKKLFRFHTISDGNAANSQIKISIANILPDEGLFDVIIRDYYDNDGTPIILERFNKCNMVPGTSNYIGLKIGTFNGEYNNKSKYVTVEVIENDMTETCVPCGFLGYPMRTYGYYEEQTNIPSDTNGYVEVEYVPSEKYIDLSGNTCNNIFISNSEGTKTYYDWTDTEFKNLDLDYNTELYEHIKPNKQYFGMSDITGVDLDVLNYKGKNTYKTNQLANEGYSNGFHLDSFINATNTINITVDGLSGYTFTTPNQDLGKDSGKTDFPHITSEDLMKNNIYDDKRYRKFTCYPYGGFDGWDIYRETRTNTKDYKANKYKASTTTKESIFTSNFDTTGLELSGNVINSDYYAYLAGYKQFNNPSKTKINLLATPGIDYINHLDLVNEVLDIIEDDRQGDCLYIVTTPDTDENGFKIDPEEVVANLEGQELSTSYMATYYPWVKYYDAANKKYINLPVTKDVMRNFAYTDNVSQSWFASAGMSRGNVECTKATHFTKLDEEDKLYEAMINPVKSFGSDGVKIWGNKTLLNEDTPVNRINVRRLMIRIKDMVRTASQQLIFEQNDNTIDSQFRSIVDPILSNVKQNRGISDYKIKTDTSAEARDRKELPAAIYVKPVNCLEYIPITFSIYPEGVNFED